jgi:hypothetical protein
MAEPAVLETVLSGAHVDAAVFGLRPDYRALLIAAEGVSSGPSDEASDALLRSAENAAREMLGDRSPEALAHAAAWREAYRAFNAKPQRTRHSLEALLRRVPGGLPRVNRLTDIYNAISVLHQLVRRAWSSRAERKPSTPSRTGSWSSNAPSPARWCGATRRV